MSPQAVGLVLALAQPAPQDVSAQGLAGKQHWGHAQQVQPAYSYHKHTNVSWRRQHNGSVLNLVLLGLQGCANICFALQYQGTP